MSAGNEHSNFDCREVRCTNRATAEAEAHRQQEREDTDTVEWIYLRNKEREWVARRVPRKINVTSKPPRWRRWLGVVADELHLEDLFLR